MRLLDVSLSAVQRASGNTEPCSSNYTGRANAWAWVEVGILMASVAGTKKNTRRKIIRDICIYKNILGELKE